MAEQLLSQGRVLILLDGLDEVMETDWHRVLQEVRNFSTQFHANHLVIACRIAALEDSLEQFTEVEVADFDEQQIASFATKWFASKDPSRGKKFIQKINEKRSIRELANNPLVLTFLCLVFEESVDLPCNHSELYKEGLELLLKKWDAKRNVERDQVYKKLSLQHKENLLSQIARTTFEQGKYFFRQKELEHYIADYIRNLPDINTQVENLQKDSEAVLKSLEVQHGLLVERARGIYSFSHLTFQEYFTAKEIVNNSHPQILDIALKKMASRITETRWHEVFLLVPSMLSNADYVLQLIKQEVDGLIGENKHLQNFLTWLSQKSYLVDFTDKLATVRAFYLDLSIGLDLKVNPANCLALKLDPVPGILLKIEAARHSSADIWFFVLCCVATLLCCYSAVRYVLCCAAVIGWGCSRGPDREVDAAKTKR